MLLIKRKWKAWSGMCLRSQKAGEKVEMGDEGRKWRSMVRKR